MSWNGRIIGFVLGFFLGGPFGAVAGVLLGFAYDSGYWSRLMGRRAQASGRATNAQVQAVFFNATFSVMGHIAKSDGHVSQSEIDTAWRVMTNMGLNEDARRRAVDAFNRGKQPQFDLDATLNELKRTCWYKPMLLRFFLETQIQIAHAEGSQLPPRKEQVLRRICQHLGVGGFSFSQFSQQFKAEQQYSQQQQRSSHGPRPASFSQIDQAYKILGVSKAATDAEVKKAYRKLMSENHPDRLIAKGVPEEMIKMATEKTQKISRAYDDITKARGV
jgi:DnaJ like chaperone protein